MDFIRAVLALRAGAFDVIWDDWSLAHVALQIVTEEGLGRNYREAKRIEDRQVCAAQKEVTRGAR